MSGVISAMTLRSSSTSRSTPAFSKQKTSCVGAMREAATATADATLSAFVLSSVPRPSHVMAEKTGVSPASSSVRSNSTFTPPSAMSPT